jgi:hypothetical protein
MNSDSDVSVAEVHRPGVSRPPLPGAVEPLLKTRAAAAFLSVSERALWGLTSPRGPIPAVRIGNSVRYDKRDLIAFVEGAKV